MKKIVILIILTISIFAKEVYFMPFDGKKAQKRISYLFSHAHKKIKIVIYSFTNKTLAKALKIAAKKGVKIDIIADKEEALYKNSQIPILAAIRNFNIRLLSGREYKNKSKAKMHVKLSIIDNRYLIIGSANYSYSAFFKNYEYIIIYTDKNLIKKFNKFYDLIHQKATPYRLSK